MILFFSGCGNSRFVAEQIAALTDDRCVDLFGGSEQEPVTLSEGEPLGVVCPIYAWAVPRVVVGRLRQLTFNVVPEYCYLACTCGDSLGRAPERFASDMKRIGLHLDAAFGFVMPETYINLPGFGLDNPDAEAKKIDAVRARLPQVAQQIKERSRVVDVVRGPLPRLMSRVVNPLFYAIFITDRKFHTTDRCIDCGLCAERCPLHNITMQDGHPQWMGHCTNCMACYHHCPKNAIHFGKATVGKGQYYFGHQIQ